LKSKHIDEMVLNQKLRERIETIKSLIVEEIDPKKVVLFGSTVKKHKKRGYDIDIFVQIDRIERRRKRVLKELIDESSGIYTVDLLFSCDLSEEFKDIIKEKGVVLYEKG